jgi:cytosine/adenosine deaminase-related metal-dependent hydrolase
VQVLRAGRVLPVAGPPVADGAIVVDGADIRALGTAEELVARHPGAAVTDLGDDGLLMPGLVDAHCHLEWSCVPAGEPADGLARWLRGFLPLRERMDAGDHLAAARAGALSALRAGTTTLADSGPTGAGVAALSELGLSGVVHLEAFGAPGAREADAQAEAVAARLRALEEIAAAPVRVGVSPHAPYSAGPGLWAGLGRHPEIAGRAWATHLAESDDEERAILEGAGDLADLFASSGLALGRWPRGAGDDSVVARVDSAAALRPGLVAAHCVRLRRGDAARLRRAGVRVAHCPRANAHLGVGTAPVPMLFGAGVAVAIGTDSPASGGDYDPRSEARACREAFGAAAPPDHQLVRMITHDAARVLGIGERTGAIAAGMRADVVALRLPGPLRDDEDPHALALDAHARVVGVWSAGRRILDEDGTPADADPGEIQAGAATVAAKLR